MILILNGVSGSGKDYAMKYMVKHYGILPIVSHTSRPMREGETNGVEYHFRTKSEFLQMIEDDRLIEYRTYNTKVDGIEDTWYYGLAKQEFDDDKNYVVILDVQGAKDFIEYYGKDKCYVVHIECDDKVRKERAMARGGFCEKEWSRRMEADKIDFSYDKLKDVVDLFVDNTDKNISDLVREILS